MSLLPHIPQHKKALISCVCILSSDAAELKTKYVTRENKES